MSDCPSCLDGRGSVSVGCRTVFQLCWDCSLNGPHSENITQLNFVNLLDCSEKLEEMRDLERREGAFTPVPSPFYMELSKLLLNQ